jgi:Uma2 family endonuclease
MFQSIEIGSIEWTAAVLLERFGAIPLNRIRHDPAPGAANERDVIDIHRREHRLYELVDGMLLEKTVGVYESYLAVVLQYVILKFVRENNLGLVLGADGMMRLAPGLVRIPDISFISWNRLPERRVPREAISPVAPNLAIEIISQSNTREEMQRKLSDYFSHGVEQLWYVYPGQREIWSYSSPSQYEIIEHDQILNGGIVLPGFTLALKDLFAEPDQAA